MSSWKSNISNDILASKSGYLEFLLLKALNSVHNYFYFYCSLNFLIRFPYYFLRFLFIQRFWVRNIIFTASPLSVPCFCFCLFFVYLLFFFLKTSPAFAFTYTVSHHHRAPHLSGTVCTCPAIACITRTSRGSRKYQRISVVTFYCDGKSIQNTFTLKVP